MHGILLFGLIALLVISGLGLIIGVLLHSGKGTGVSETLSGTTGSRGGTSIIEKNLDRLTVIFAVAFMVTLLLLMLVYPQGSIAGMESDSLSGGGFN